MKRCETCLFYEPCKYTVDTGHCRYKFPQEDRQPDSVVIERADEMHKDEGTKCPCWSDK